MRGRKVNSHVAALRRPACWPRPTGKVYGLLLPHCRPACPERSRRDRSGWSFPLLANASTGRVVEGSASPRAAEKVFREYLWVCGGWPIRQTTASYKKILFNFVDDIR